MNSVAHTAKLNRIHTMNEKHIERLKKIGINSVEKLLQEGGNRVKRDRIARETRISMKLLEKWVHHADFFRIRGLAGLKAELLEACGVNTMKKLAAQNPEKLYDRMFEVNTKRKLVERVPGLVQVKRWVGEAKRAKRAVS